MEGCGSNHEDEMIDMPSPSLMKIVSEPGTHLNTYKTKASLNGITYFMFR